jgi:hypothetical protein
MDTSSIAASLAARLGPLLADLPARLRPCFLALLERKAAERYAGWADTASSDTESAKLRACAERERTIAARVEHQFAVGPQDTARYAPLVAEAARVYDAAFTELTRREAFAVQATLERAGAATWRAFAAGAADPSIRALLLECATLEEASADVLDTI